MISMVGLEDLDDLGLNLLECAWHAEEVKRVAGVSGKFWLYAMLEVDVDAKIYIYDADTGINSDPEEGDTAHAFTFTVQLANTYHASPIVAVVPQADEKTEKPYIPEIGKVIDVGMFGFKDVEEVLKRFLADPFTSDYFPPETAEQQIAISLMYPDKREIWINAALWQGGRRRILDTQTRRETKRDNGGAKAHLFLVHMPHVAAKPYNPPMFEPRREPYSDFPDDLFGWGL
jgi:hypothetical protein